MGFMTFVLLAFPYMEAFQKNSSGTETEGMSGYKIMDFSLWEGMEASFFGGLLSFLEIILIIGGIAMLAYGAYCIVKDMGLFSIDAIPDEVCSKVYSKYALIGYAGISVISLISAIIISSSNTKTIETWIAGEYSIGLRCGIGIIITALLSIGTVVVDMFVIPKLNLPEDGNAPRVSYVCTKCGKTAKKGVNFCPSCGGTVEEKAVGTIVYECSQCGKTAKKDAKFCPQCGGAVVSKEILPSVYLCSKCGKASKPDVKFCSSCGGEIIKK